MYLNLLVSRSIFSGLIITLVVKQEISFEEIVVNGRTDDEYTSITIAHLEHFVHMPTSGKIA